MIFSKTRRREKNDFVWIPAWISSPFLIRILMSFHVFSVSIFVWIFDRVFSGLFTKVAPKMVRCGVDGSSLFGILFRRAPFWRPLLVSALFLVHFCALWAPFWVNFGDFGLLWDPFWAILHPYGTHFAPKSFFLSPWRRPRIIFGHFSWFPLNFM